MLSGPAPVAGNQAGLRGRSAGGVTRTGRGPASAIGCGSCAWVVRWRGSKILDVKPIWKRCVGPWIEGQTSATAASASAPATAASLRANLASRQNRMQSSGLASCCSSWPARLDPLCKGSGNDVEPAGLFFFGIASQKKTCQVEGRHLARRLHADHPALRVVVPAGVGVAGFEPAGLAASKGHRQPNEAGRHDRRRRAPDNRCLQEAVGFIYIAGGRGCRIVTAKCLLC